MSSPSVPPSSGASNRSQSTSSIGARTNEPQTPVNKVNGDSVATRTSRLAAERLSLSSGKKGGEVPLGASHTFTVETKTSSSQVTLEELDKQLTDIEAAAEKYTKEKVKYDESYKNYRTLSSAEDRLSRLIYKFRMDVVKAPTGREEDRSAERTIHDRWVRICTENEQVQKIVTRIQAEEAGRRDTSAPSRELSVEGSEAITKPSFEEIKRQAGEILAKRKKETKEMPTYTELAGFILNINKQQHMWTDDQRSEIWSKLILMHEDRELNEEIEKQVNDISPERSSSSIPSSATAPSDDGSEGEPAKPGSVQKEVEFVNDLGKGSSVSAREEIVGEWEKPNASAESPSPHEGIGGRSPSWPLTDSVMHAGVGSRPVSSAGVQTESGLESPDAVRSPRGDARKGECQEWSSTFVEMHKQLVNVMLAQAKVMQTQAEALQQKSAFPEAPAIPSTGETPRIFQAVPVMGEVAEPSSDMIIPVESDEYYKQMRAADDEERTQRLRSWLEGSGNTKEKEPNKASPLPTYTQYAKSEEELDEDYRVAFQNKAIEEETRMRGVIEEQNANELNVLMRDFEAEKVKLEEVANAKKAEEAKKTETAKKMQEVIAKAESEFKAGTKTSHAILAELNGELGKAGAKVEIAGKLDGALGVWGTENYHSVPVTYMVTITNAEGTKETKEFKRTIYTMTNNSEVAAQLALAFMETVVKLAKEEGDAEFLAFREKALKKDVLYINLNKNSETGRAYFGSSYTVGLEQKTGGRAATDLATISRSGDRVRFDFKTMKRIEPQDNLSHGRWIREITQEEADMYESGIQVDYNALFEAAKKGKSFETLTSALKEKIAEKEKEFEAARQRLVSQRKLRNETASERMKKALADEQLLRNMEGKTADQLLAMQLPQGCSEDAAQLLELKKKAAAKSQRIAELGNESEDIKKLDLSQAPASGLFTIEADRANLKQILTSHGVSQTDVDALNDEDLKKQAAEKLEGEAKTLGAELQHSDKKNEELQTQKVSDEIASISENITHMQRLQVEIESLKEGAETYKRLAEAAMLQSVTTPDERKQLDVLVKDAKEISNSNTAIKKKEEREKALKSIYELSGEDIAPAGMATDVMPSNG